MYRGVNGWMLQMRAQGRVPEEGFGGIPEGPLRIKVACECECECVKGVRKGLGVDGRARVVCEGVNGGLVWRRKRMEAAVRSSR